MMNIFLKAIQENKIKTQEDLKRIFLQMAKKLHPDVSSLNGNNDIFIRLKNDFDDAERYFLEQNIPSPIIGKPDRELCIQLFIELMASNFPIEKRIRNRKPYIARIEKLNTELSAFGIEYKNLFLAFEKEMYELKGENITNHDYALTILYLYSFSDYTYLRYKTSENHIKNGYKIIYKMLKEHSMKNSIFFINWLIKDIIGENNLNN